FDSQPCRHPKENPKRRYLAALQIGRTLCRVRERTFAGGAMERPSSAGSEGGALTGQVCLDALQTAFVVAALALCLRGTGPHALVEGDSRPVILTAGSLVREGDWDIREFLPAGELPYFAQHTHGGVYSSYPSGMVPFALPVAAAARLLGADFNSPQVHERLEK